ncbi:MAG: DUF3343 domain-containing protein [Halanaerobium sp.]
MGVENEKLILFQSTHHSIKAEKVLMENDIIYRMAAVPPEVSADCGSAIAFSLELDSILKMFEENNILVKAIYEIAKNKTHKEYKKIYAAE